MNNDNNNQSLSLLSSLTIQMLTEVQANNNTSLPISHNNARNWKILIESLNINTNNNSVTTNNTNANPTAKCNPTEVPYTANTVARF